MPGSSRCYETFRAAFDVGHAAVAVAVTWLLHCLYTMRSTLKIRAGWSKRQLTGRGGVRQLSLAKYTIQSKGNYSPTTQPVFEHLLKNILWSSSLRCVTFRSEMNTGGARKPICHPLTYNNTITFLVSADSSTTTFSYVLI